MVEFQKNQCFFAGAIQIANLIYSAGQTQMLRGTPDLIDEGFLYILATNGFIPTIFTLTLIARFGRQSWYLISLSGSIFVLSTLSLAATQRFWREFASIEVVEVEIDFISPILGLSCGVGYDQFQFQNLTSLFCGPEVVLSDPSVISTSPSRWAWLAWTNALLWLLYCATMQILTMAWVESKAAKLSQSWQRHTLTIPPLQQFLRTPYWNLLWQSLFVATWTASFGYQFYLYSLSFRRSTINNSWGFGQVVAIAVWAPCIAEYLNLEISKSSFEILITRILS